MSVELIDSHAHLDESAFDADRDEVVARYAEHNVSAVVTIGTTASSSRQIGAFRWAASFVHVLRSADRGGTMTSPPARNRHARALHK